MKALLAVADRHRRRVASEADRQFIDTILAGFVNAPEQLVEQFHEQVSRPGRPKGDDGGRRLLAALVYHGRVAVGAGKAGPELLERVAKRARLTVDQLKHANRKHAALVESIDGFAQKGLRDALNRWEVELLSLRR